MSVAVASRVPSLEDARVAAAACGEADESVEDVLLFGSVARGEPGADSDIDLLVLVSKDIDGQEDNLTDLFSERAEAVSGADCDVVVRTAHQWEHLITNVSASFEASIESEALKLFHREPTKREHLRCTLSGVPIDNSAVAADHAAAAATILKELTIAIRTFGEEENVPKGFEPDKPEQVLQDDAQSLLSKSHLAIELLIRSMGASGGKTSLGKTHNLDKMVDKIKGDFTTDAGKVRGAIKRTLGPLRTVDGKVMIWRISPYLGRRPGWVKLSTQDNAFNHVKAAVTLARMAADELLKHPSVSDEPAEVSGLLNKRAAQIVEALPPDVGLEWEQLIWDDTEE